VSVQVFVCEITDYVRLPLHVFVVEWAVLLEEQGVNELMVHGYLGVVPFDLLDVRSGLDL